MRKLDAAAWATILLTTLFGTGVVMAGIMVLEYYMQG